MFVKKIKSKLHKLLFPRLAERLDALSRNFADEQQLVENYKKTCESYRQDIAKLQDSLREKNKKPKPTMADLMRECLGLLPLDFTNVMEDRTLEEKMHMSPDELAQCDKEVGLPKDFLDTVDKDKRETYIAQLYQIWQMEVFSVMIDYYINLQGNWSFKKAIDDMQLFAGRLSCNGIYLIKNKVKAGFDEYKERSKPPEEFDEHELDEGFDISNLTNKK